MESFNKPQLSETVKILIGTPCYGGMVTDKYMQSLLSAILQLQKIGIEIAVMTIGSESLIPRARNTVVAYFLSEPLFTHLLFIDADIEFNSDAILKLLHADKDIIAAAYPKKTIDFHKIGNTAFQCKTATDFMNAGTSYVVNFIHDPELPANIIKVHNNNLIRVNETGTGFLLIKRNVFSKLRKEYPQLQYLNDVEAYGGYHPEMKNNFWLFFDCMKDTQTNRYLSEDYAFCKRCKDAHFDIWLDITIQLNHIGPYSFHGNIKSLFTTYNPV